MADNDTGFLINGERYELPDMGTFTIKESRVFHRETGLVPEVVRMRLQAGEITFMDLLENIGFLPALATVAYMREHDDTDDATVEKLIAATTRDDLFMALLDAPEDDAVPPSEGVTSTPPEQSPNGSSEKQPSTEPSKSSSGMTSTPSSVRPDVPADSIGTTELDTWATLDPQVSVT
jgi:hypothetical protein